MGFVADAGLSIAQGFEGQAAAKSEQAQYQFNARSEQIAADQDEAARLADLNGTLSSITAVRTSRGLDAASPTGMAIAQAMTKRAQQGIDASRFNYLTKAQSDMFGAQQAGIKGTAALLGGFLQAGQDSENAAKQYMQLGGFGG